jgi:hypothetical protein
MPIRHIVRQGECLASIAARYGIASLGDISGHPDNSALREQDRASTVLAPGDVVAIPERPARTFSVREGGDHRFRVQVPRTRLRMKLVGADGGLSGVAYRLEVGGQTIEGQTDGEGMLDEPVPASAAVATIVLTESQRRLDVRLGGLDPHGSPAGMRQRLAGLGFTPEDDGEEALEAAAVRYRQARGMDPAGGLDEELAGRLRDEHGS